MQTYHRHVHDPFSCTLTLLPGVTNTLTELKKPHLVMEVEAHVSISFGNVQDAHFTSQS